LTSQPSNNRLNTKNSQSIYLFQTSKGVNTEADQQMDQRINKIGDKINLMTEQMHQSDLFKKSFDSRVRSQNAVDSMLQESQIVKNKSFYSFNY
jgi:hypothetical protein